MVARIEAEFGSISILVNNAGISRPQPLYQITEREWDGILALNLKSMFLHYSASKFAINGLTQALADEGKADHIKAIAICPAMVATPMTGVSGKEYLQAQDIAETVLYLLRLSPAAWPTEVVLERRDAS